jgi:hypothetical protein
MTTIGWKWKQDRHEPFANRQPNFASFAHGSATPAAVVVGSNLFSIVISFLPCFTFHVSFLLYITSVSPIHSHTQAPDFSTESHLRGDTHSKLASSVFRELHTSDAREPLRFVHIQNTRNHVEPAAPFHRSR